MMDLTALLAKSSGRREILGLASGPVRGRNKVQLSQTFWTAFLRSLAQRGVKLVIFDSHEGIKAAVSRVSSAKALLKADQCWQQSIA